MEVTFAHWFWFNVGILLLLWIDLWHFNRRPHHIEIKEALLLSSGWILIAFLFNIWIYYRFGQEPALNFLTGYLLEKSLSIDNLFIFLLIFSYFQVPPEAKHRVLFFGILGAIVMRALLIWAGIFLVSYFHWIFYLFGLFLIYTGIRLWVKKEEEQITQENNLIYRIVATWIPLTSTYHGQSFFVKIDQKWVGTPLLLVLLIIETTDLIFALDSVPAILGITTDAFIVYTSNIFAILGLRSLFFALENLMSKFYLLHYALAVILAFIGVKMLLIDVIEIPTMVTLILLLVMISSSVLLSLVYPKNEKT